MVKPHHCVIQRSLSVPHPPLQVGICIPASVWSLFIHANARVNIYRIHACRSRSPMGPAQLPPAALTHVLMKSLHVYFCFLFCQLTHTHTHMNWHQTVLNYMHPQVNPSTVVYLRFSHVPALYVSAASVFYLLFLFASHLPHRVFLFSLSFFFCCCSLSAGNAMQPSLLCKCMSQEKQ